MKLKNKVNKFMRLRIGPVAHVVLSVIAVSGLITVAICAPNALQLLKPFLKDKRYSSKQSINRSIDSLIKTGLVTRSFDHDGNPMLELTTRGRWEAGIRGMTREPTKKKWDGKWRVVVFDIPNSKEKLRNELRRGVRLYGFHLLQKSVWVYPYPCDEFVTLLREHLEIDEDVLYMTVSTIENEKELRKEFKI